MEEARGLLKGMPDMTSPLESRMQLQLLDPVHSLKDVPKNTMYSKYMNYNIYFKNGEKAAILITGGK